MQITKEHIAYKKKIGRLDDAQVYEVATTGGLHIVLSVKNGRQETLGTGPHRAVARHIAKKRAPAIEFTDLSKADHIEPEHFEWLLPRYEALTDRFQQAEAELAAAKDA